MDKDGFYHITHISNLESILKRGLYSHDQVRKCKILPSIVYDRDIVEWRGYIPTARRKSLHEYVNLYFNPRNPMMYRVKVHERRDVAVVQVNSRVLDRKDVLLADGNAAANATAFHPVDMKTLAQLRQQVDRESWNDPDEAVKKENKRKMMAECLVPEHVPPTMIEAVHVVDRRSADRVMQLLSGTGIRLIVNPHMFFSSGKKWEYVKNVPRPAPVSHPRSIPQHSGKKVAIQPVETPAQPSPVSPVDTSVDTPANTPESASAIPSAAVQTGTPAPIRRKGPQALKSEVKAPIADHTVSSRAGKKSRTSIQWDWLVFLILMIFFVLVSYEVSRLLTS